MMTTRRSPGGAFTGAASVADTGLPVNHPVTSTTRCAASSASNATPAVDTPMIAALATVSWARSAFTAEVVDRTVRAGPATM